MKITVRGPFSGVVREVVLAQPDRLPEQVILTEFSEGVGGGSTLRIRPSANGGEVLVRLYDDGKTFLNGSLIDFTASPWSIEGPDWFDKLVVRRGWQLVESIVE